MIGILDGRNVIAAGAARGLGREQALKLARRGARVVVDDRGTSHEGEGVSRQLAYEVVAAIRAVGGEAVANRADVADFAAAGEMVQQAIDTFGSFDIPPTNARFMRDRIRVNTTEGHGGWALGVHPNGHFAPIRQAATFRRDEAKAGRTRSNAIAPSAGTGMANGPCADKMAPSRDRFDMMRPASVSPVVAWLASENAADVTDRVIEFDPGRISVENDWDRGPELDLGERWTPAAADESLRALPQPAWNPEPVYGA